MKETQFYRWWIVDERTGKRRRTRYMMRVDEAQERFPGCEPDLGTREVRLLPETEAELRQDSGLLHQRLTRKGA